MTSTVDFKKTEKELYQFAKNPTIIKVPSMPFFMIDGQGDPNSSEEYQSAIEILYTLAYSVKMRKKGTPPSGYFDFVVPPLEGLWIVSPKGENETLDKSRFRWTAMLRQPDFVTDLVFEETLDLASKKKPDLNFHAARLERFEEGLCGQISHLGSYDSEGDTLNRLYKFIENANMQTDFSEKRRHHEIYLSDPRKTAEEKRKTLIRVPIIEKV
jgi:hypothetical protein